MTLKSVMNMIKAAGTPSKRPAQPAAQPTLAAAQSTATAAAVLPSDDAAPVRRNRLARRLKVLLAQRKAKRTGEPAPVVVVAQEEEPTPQAEPAPQEEDQPTQEEAQPPQEELPLVTNEYGLTPEERVLIHALVSGMMERVVARQTAATGDKAAAALLLARLLARVSPLFARNSVGGADSGNDNNGSGNDSGDNDDGVCSPAAGGKADKAASGAALKAKLVGAWLAARKSLLLPRRCRRATTAEREDVAAPDSPPGVSAVVIAAPAALEGAAVNGQQAVGQAVGKSSGKKASAVLVKVKRGLCFSV